MALPGRGRYTGRGMRSVSLLTGLFLLFACGKPPRAAEDDAPPLHLAGTQGAEDAGDERENVEYLRMVVPRGEGEDDESVRARAETVVGLLRQPGTSFLETAQSYGAGDANRVRMTRAEARASAIGQAVLQLRVGQTSAPLATEAGFVIVQRRPNPPPGPPSIEARHILVMHAESARVPEGITRTRDEARTRAEEVVVLLRDGAEWVATHREYSDEPGAAEGGSLGRFERGAMVPAFENVAFLLAPDEISDVVETPFGFHIIQRVR